MELLGSLSGRSDSNFNGQGEYCICRKKYKEGEFMIECTICNDWFHGRCVNVSEENAHHIDEYHCPSCHNKHGPLKLKKRYLLCFDEKRENKPVSPGKIRTGTNLFMTNFKNRKYPSALEIPIPLEKGENLTLDYFISNHFEKPILVSDKTGLDIKVPSHDFSPLQIELLVGSMKEVDVIDVKWQDDHKIFLREWIDYFTNSNKTKVLNLLSLEFSQTKLSEYVEAPRIVHDLSWVSTAWPSYDIDATYFRPDVQKYCLMSAAGSYTDFHVDFGGTSVWYHIVRGEKNFYIIEPTEVNLKLYEEWMVSPQQPEIFLADLTDKCYRLDVKEGETVFLPSGWIHAVYTPVESLIFGGNFLHTFAALMQLNIYKLEKRICVPFKYLYPNFEPLHWFIAKDISNKIQDSVAKWSGCPAYLLDTVRIIVKDMKIWILDKQALKEQPIPSSVDGKNLLRDLDFYISNLTIGPSANEKNQLFYYCKSPKISRKRNKNFDFKQFIKR